MTALHQFLQGWNRPFVRGVSDCCAFAAAWLEIRTGRSVECPHLGRPLTDVQASAILGGKGGLRPIVSRSLTEHGCFEREGEPQDGDIVIADRVQGFSCTLLGIASSGYLVSVAHRGGMRMIDLKELKNLTVYGSR